MFSVVFSREDFIRKSNAFRQQIAEQQRNHHVVNNNADAKTDDDDPMTLITKVNAKTTAIMVPIIQTLKDNANKKDNKSSVDDNTSPNTESSQQETQNDEPKTDTGDSKTDGSHATNNADTSDANNNDANIESKTNVPENASTNGGETANACQRFCNNISKDFEHVISQLREWFAGLSLATKKAMRGFAIGAAMGLVTSLVHCVIQGKSPRETIAIVLRDAVVSGFGAGTIAWITEYTIQHWDTIKTVLFGIGSEVTEKTARQYCTAIVGPLVSTAFELIHWFGSGFVTSKFSHMKWSEIFSEFGSKLLDSLVIGFGTAFASVAIANAMSWFVTLVIMMIIGAMITKLKQEAKLVGTSATMAIVKGVASVPYSIMALFMPTRAEADDIPRELECIISRELLRDPVWVCGEWYERGYAEGMIGQRNHIGVTMTQEQIVECREMRDLVRWYRKSHFYDY